MQILQQDLANRYAHLLDARATWFMYAQNTVDALAKIGLIGACDHLVVFADDFEDDFRDFFKWGNVTFINDPLPGSFLAASGWINAGEAKDLSPLPAPAPVRNIQVNEATRSAAPSDVQSEKKTITDVLNAQEKSVSPTGLAVSGSSASYAYPAGIHARRTYWFVGAIGGMGLRVPNLRLLGQAALSCGATLIVDNTVPSPFGCSPFKYGVHIVLDALDRVAAGHLDKKVVAVSVAPSITGRGRKRIVRPEAEDAYRLLSFGLGLPFDNSTSGYSLNSFDLGVLDAGISSLNERMQLHADHARALAEYLSCHPAVGHVFYPGLKEHCDHDVAATTLQHGFGPAVDFALQGSHKVSARVLSQVFVDISPCAHREQAAGGALTRMGVVSHGNTAVVRLFAGTDNPLGVVDALEKTFRRMS